MIEQSKRDLIYKIARDYYQENKTQQEIADKYGISRITVSRLLAKAVEEKIIEIRINIPDNPSIEIERRIEEKYGLTEAIVVVCNTDDYKEILSMLGSAAVDFMQRNLQGNETISISWGFSLLSMVNLIPQSSYPNITITQMIGGLGYPEEHMSGTELVRRMSNTLNAEAVLLNSPGIVKEKNLCTSLKQEPQVRLALEKAKTSDMAFVGLGYFGVDSALRKSDLIFSPQDLKFLDKHGAAGDISLRFFNKQGEFITGNIDERIVGLSVEEIKKIPRVVGIAGGKKKWQTIRAALNTSLVDVLITDDKTATELLK
jgi:DNA-binding transcriptional regulator LsrR (DeoR family)